MVAFKGVEGREGMYLSGFLRNRILRSPTIFRVERLSSRLPAVDVDGGGDGGVDAASRGLGLRYKANIFPE